MTAAVVALTVSASGSAAAFFAQAVAPTSDVTTWVSAGGATAAVTGLAYIARLLAAGRLVAYPVEKLQEEGNRREERLTAMLEAANRREDNYYKMLAGQPKRGGNA